VSLPASEIRRGGGGSLQAHIQLFVAGHCPVLGAVHVLFCMMEQCDEFPRPHMGTRGGRQRGRRWESCHLGQADWWSLFGLAPDAPVLLSPRQPNAAYGAAYAQSLALSSIPPSSRSIWL